MLSRVFIDMTLLRGLVGTVTPLFVDTSPLLEFVEGTVPKRFVVLPGVEAFEGFTAMEGFLALTGLVGVPGMTGGESAGEGMSKCWRGRCMLRVTAAAAPTTLITFPVSFKLSLPETGGPSSGPELRV